MSYTITRRTVGVILFTLVLSVLLFSVSWSAVSQTQPHVPRPYLVADINPGPDSSNPDFLTAGSETLYAFASDPDQRGLWATDGSEENTQFVHEIYSPYVPTPVAQYGAPVTVGDNVFYVDNDAGSNYGLWVSDGSPTGTMMINEILNGASSFPGYFLGNLTQLNDNELLFRSYDEFNGYELWLTDGTITHTHILTDIVPGAANAWPYSLIPVNNSVYFRALNNTMGNELWRTDGTSAGTELLVEIPSTGVDAFLDELTYVDGLFFFTVYHQDFGREYWRSDGTQIGTWLLKDIAPGTPSSQWYDEHNYIGFDGNFYFEANDYGAYGSELWRSDGTQENTVLLKDINPGSESSWPNFMDVANGLLFFAANDGVHGVELWASDGTESGTAMVLDINPDGSSINGSRYTSLLFQISFNDLYFFQANDGVHGMELWQSDGTAEGTVMVMDIIPGPVGSEPRGFAVLGNTLYFTAEDGVHGREIWALSHAAIAEDDYVITRMGQPAAIIFLENDNYLDPDQLEIAIASQPQHGAVVLNGSTFIYTPDIGYIGADSFTYTISDGTSEPEAAIVYISVEGEILYLPVILQSSTLNKP